MCIPRPNVIVQTLIAAGLVGGAYGQGAPEQRVEITGSSIKRIQAEGALPLQVIRAEDIVRQGITSAEQLVQVLSVNGNGVDNMVTNQGGDFLNSLLFSGRGANNGSAAASLRGLGPQNTLVLLNGRRVSPHGLNGKSVDLNSIPMAAIDRIEILKDGASAIYGTDAIGGVMNFILKRDYRGLETAAFADLTEAGGGNIYRGSITFGAGDLDSSGFNLVATLQYDKQERLRGSERGFHNGYQPERGLAPDTTGAPYATINAAAGTALPRSFTLPGSSVSYNRFNPLALTNQCNTLPNTYVYRGDITGFNNNNVSCTYDYGKDWSLQQPVERLNFVGRGMFKLGRDHTGSVELTASKVTSNNEYTHNQITVVSRGANYPAYLRDLQGNEVRDANGNRIRSPYYVDMTGIVPGYNNQAPIRLRWRCIDCGTRKQETESETYRVLLAAEGLLAGWDYKLGLSTASSKGDTNYLDGYLNEARFKAVMETGLINPFLRPGQTQTAEALALIESAKFRGPLYGGEAKLDQFDLVGSRELIKLPAGPLAVAFGIDLRQESFRFRNDTVGQPAIIGAGSPAALAKAERDITAVFAELAVPLVKNLEAQVAVRHDRYSDFGETTNPKVALRWQPSQQFLMRGSYNTGFHAPDFGPLYEGENTGQFNSDIDDPVFCRRGPGITPDPNFCNIRPATITGGNPNLKPESSKQWSLGFVVAPADWFSASVDLFQIEIKDRLAVRTPQEVIANFQTLGDLIVRNPDNTIDFVRAGWINVAGDEVKGADVNLKFNWNTGIGRFALDLTGTYLDSFRSRKSANEPWSERVGEFGDFDFLWDLKLRWKHTATLTWSRGPWSATLTQNHSSGYKQEVDGYGSGVILADKGFPSRISSYTLYNASVSYTGIKNLTLTLGVKNLLDKDPPFSYHNVDNVAGAGWDARVGDPRGRAFTFRANYKFW
jgi:iron complex outermembrane receptor protein